MAMALALGGWALWLAWIAGALALVAAIYAGLDEHAFQKRSDGSLSPAARWLLAPYLAGAWVNSRWWTRRHPLASEVVPGLRLGRIPARGDCEAHGVIGVVDLSAELPCAAGGALYMVVPQLDLTVATRDHLENAVRAIDRAAANGPTLVCCALGVSRSAVAVAAWLIASGRARDVEEAVATVRRARPAAVLGAAHLAALEAFARDARRTQ